MRGQIGKFSRNRSGVAAVEFALALPLLLLIFFGSVTLFDLYRTSMMLDRATATISDFVSRQTEVSEAFMLDAVQLRLHALAGAGAQDLEYRVESFKKTGGALANEWSYPPAEGPLLRARPADNEMPLVSDGDTLIVVRTALRQRTISAMLGFSDHTHHSMLAVRPRFTKVIASTW